MVCDRAFSRKVKVIGLSVTASWLQLQPHQLHFSTIAIFYNIKDCGKNYGSSQQHSDHNSSCISRIYLEFSAIPSNTMKLWRESKFKTLLHPKYNKLQHRTPHTNANINNDYQKYHIIMISYLCMEITSQRGHFSFTKHAHLHTHWQKINSPISRTKHSHRHTQQRSLYFDSVQQISKRAKPTIHKTSKNQSLS